MSTRQQQLEQCKAPIAHQTLTPNPKPEPEPLTPPPSPNPNLNPNQAEIVRQTGFARDAIAFFEAPHPDPNPNPNQNPNPNRNRNRNRNPNPHQTRHPRSKLNDKDIEHRAMPRKHFDDFCTGDPKHGKPAEVDECGDADAVPLARACVAEGLKRAAVPDKEPEKIEPYP